MFMAPIYQCAACDIIFQQPKERHYLGDIVEVCPRCNSEALDWDIMGDEVINTIFWVIIGESFSETRRMNLRSIAEAQMAPYNRLTRGL